VDSEQHLGLLGTCPCLPGDPDVLWADSKQVVSLDEISYDGLALNISSTY